MAKFICNKCNKIVETQKYSVKIKGSKLINIDNSTKKEILCCEEAMEFLDENKGPINVNFGKFNSMTPLERQQVLRKRSQDDAKKQKYRDQDREKYFYNA